MTDHGGCNASNGCEYGVHLEIADRKIMVQHNNETNTVELLVSAEDADAGTCMQQALGSPTSVDRHDVDTAHKALARLQVTWRELLLGATVVARNRPSEV